VTQLKEWTDKGAPVMISWNPEGRDWSHASVVFDVTEGLPEGGLPSYCTGYGDLTGRCVWVADSNMPNPEKLVRVCGEDFFYSKWSEKWPNYLVRRVACAIEREITSEGRQVMAGYQPHTMDRLRREQQRLEVLVRDLSGMGGDSLAAELSGPERKRVLEYIVEQRRMRPSARRRENLNEAQQALFSAGRFGSADPLRVLAYYTERS
jgi:hypothetical protein